MLNKRNLNNSSVVTLFMFTYFISYITRINFAAVIAEMVNATPFSKTSLSLAITGISVTYGAGQIISGICGDRINPKKLVTFGLALSAAMNFLIPFCASAWQMTVLWCINGFAQSFMWPPIVALLTILLPSDAYSRATVKISWGSSLGTIFVYLAAPLLIHVSSWKAIFFVSAAAGAIMVFVWNVLCPVVEPAQKNADAKQKSKNAVSVFSPIMLCIMLAIILQGALRDGVTTWMPSYISDTYNLSSVISILTGVLLPIFSIVCFHLSERLYNKVFTNPLKCAGIIFGAGAFSALMIQIFTGVSAAMSVVFSAALTGSMHGVNLMLICMVPAYFKKGGNVSTVSGVLNSCTYIGSAIYTYGAALISDNFGWGATVSSWTLIAIVGTVVCLAIGYPLSKKTGIFE
ncbi:MAG: MFS transporter [Ruminococcaceae bacterium]|nr:MFS transporter [Oscillospiraceae bacterium]